MARRTLEHNMPRISFQTHPRWRTVDSACVCSVCVAVIRDPCDRATRHTVGCGPRVRRGPAGASAVARRPCAPRPRRRASSARPSRRRVVAAPRARESVWRESRNSTRETPGRRGVFPNQKLDTRDGGHLPPPARQSTHYSMHYIVSRVCSACAPGHGAMASSTSSMSLRSPWRSHASDAAVGW